jgi:hypothetical protein
MEISNRQFWLLVHLGLGALYIHGFGSGLLGLAGDGHRHRMASVGAALLAFAALASVITGTWMVYPWYRAAAPPGADLALYPRNWLLATESLSHWHKFGMEWKEHVAWLSPMFATAVAAVVIGYRHRLKELGESHTILRVFLAIAFFSGLVAGGLGAALNKVAPNSFLMH